MKVNLFEIKQGKLEKWLEWGQLLMTQYREEAVQDLIIRPITR